MKLLQSCTHVELECYFAFYNSRTIPIALPDYRNEVVEVVFQRYCALRRLFCQLDASGKVSEFGSV